MPTDDNGWHNDSSATVPIDRRKFIGAIGASVPVILAGCTSDTTTQSGGDGANPNSGDGTPKPGGTLQWGGAVPVQGLDPHLDTSAASKRVLENMYEGLVQLHPDYSLKPLLAKSIKKNEDKTLLSMDLRKGIKFHNGKEMTSEDVMASYSRVANGDMYIASGFFDFVETMKAPDDYKFEIELTKPFSPFIAKMSTPELAIMPKELAQKKRATNPIGTGPYKYAGREIGSSFTMSKFDEYWSGDDGGPYLNKIHKTPVSDSTVRLRSFKAGKFDFINNVAPKDVNKVKNMPNTRFEKEFPKSLVYLGMNCNQKPFNNKHARLALNFTLDKGKIAKAALFGSGRPTASPAVPGSPWVNPNVKPRPRNLEKAKEHLEKAGMPDGYSASFKIPIQYPLQVQGAKVIADMASDVGIELDIQKITWTSWLSNVYTKQNFQATTSSYLGLWNPDISFYKFLHPDGAFFFTGWVNEKYNKHVEKARHLYDVEKRKDLYWKATEILHQDRAGHLFLWWQPRLFASVDSYKGPIGAPDGSALRFGNNWLDR